MRVKIDTKEAFHVISIEESVLTANMAEELSSILAEKQQDDPKNLIINLNKVAQIDTSIAILMKKIHQQMYSEKKSFVLCELTPAVKNEFGNLGMLEMINHTPTESEAYDIVLMEEIERELDSDL
jgi:anti-anti-sigma regulatory factor